MSQPKLLDPVLIFLLNELRKKNAALPPGSKPMGLRAYCKEAGILLPEDWREIERWETPMKDEGYSEEGYE